MSEGRALINFIGNAVAAVVISKSEHSVDEEKYNRIVEKNVGVAIASGS
jgi:aerobic C4-dicarboxylate transport protein